MKQYLKQLYDWGIEKTEQLSGAPDVLMGRLLVYGILLFFVAVMGIFFCISFGQYSYFVFMVVIILFLVIRIVKLVRTIKNKDYEIYEGKVLKVSGRIGPSQFMKVKVEIDGEETKFLLNKGVKVKTGHTYRFYFRKEKDSLPGILGRFDTGAFYGVEEVE